MIDGQVRGPGLATARENVVGVGRVRGPGLSTARMYFVETVRPYRPELAVSEEFISSQVVT